MFTDTQTQIFQQIFKSGHNTLYKVAQQPVPAQNTPGQQTQVPNNEKWQTDPQYKRLLADAEKRNGRALTGNDLEAFNKAFGNYKPDSNQRSLWNPAVYDLKNKQIRYVKTNDPVHFVNQLKTDISERINILNTAAASDAAQRQQEAYEQNKNNPHTYQPQPNNATPPAITPETITQAQLTSGNGSYSKILYAHKAKEILNNPMHPVTKALRQGILDFGNIKNLDQFSIAVVNAAQDLQAGLDSDFSDTNPRKLYSIEQSKKMAEAHQQRLVKANQMAKRIYEAKNSKDALKAANGATDFWSFTEGQKMDDITNILFGKNKVQAYQMGQIFGNRLASPEFLEKLTKNPQQANKLLAGLGSDSISKIPQQQRAAFMRGISTKALQHLEQLQDGKQKLSYIKSMSLLANKLKLPKEFMDKRSLATMKDITTKYAWNAVKQDWTLFNQAVSIWARNKGWGGFADFADNPLMFYGALAALVLGGGVMLTNAISSGGNQPQYAPPQARPGVTPYGYYG